MKLDCKTGDYVALYTPTRLCGVFIEKIRVDRVTKTQIIIGNKRYRKVDGCKIGSCDQYECRPYIRSLSPGVEQDIAEYKARIEKANLIDKIKKTDYRKIPLETLKQIIELINNQ